jgi:4'-phosphopantetheinyl transferase
MKLSSNAQGPGLFLAGPPVWTLGPGHIRVWLWSLKAGKAMLERMSESLSGDERRRSGELKFDAHQRRFVAARAGLRKILANVLGESPEALVFSYSARGKPSLSDPEGPAGPRFNLSHSEDVAMLALSWGIEVGLDLEAEGEDHPSWDMAELTFNPVEIEWLNEHSTTDFSKAFMELWTLKEAVLKAEGSGLAAGSEQYSVIPESSGCARVLGHPDGLEQADWQARSFCPLEGFRAAIAWREHPGRSPQSMDRRISLQCLDWETSWE